jgi:uncharacterized protein YyaL (SSP411 family)
MPIMAQDMAKTKQKKSETKTEVKAGDENVYEKVYDEKIDAIEQIDQAHERAEATGRKVICQVGGNWCPWCLRFANFITEDKEIAELIEKHYVYIHVNTSKENKNKDALLRLGNPGRFGYPVFVILNHDGSVLHIQNSAYLEEGKGYNRKKVLEFLQNWTDEAIENIR